LPAFPVPPPVQQAVPAKKEKPALKVLIPNTDWLRITTNKGNVFYTHKARKESFWAVPDEIKDAVAALEINERDARKREEEENAKGATNLAEEERDREIERIKAEVQDAVKRKAEEDVPLTEVVVSKKARVEEASDDEEGEDEDESDEEALSDAAVRARLARVYVPEAERDYLHLNLYNVHQRVAQQFRRGRVFLCGDAAHVNNPIGGLGLNSGIHEAWHLARLLNGGGDLDDYERVRRPLNIEYVQEQTIANKKRLEERDPLTREKRFDELRRMADDPVKHKAFLMRAALLEGARRLE